MSEMNLERSDAKRSTSASPGASANKPADVLDFARGLKRRYTLWCAIAPSVIFMAAFGVLCARECTALPWLTFIYAPAIALAVILVVALIIWIRAGELPHEERSSVRWYIVASILWGPLVAYAGFAVTLSIAQFFGAIVSR